LGIGVSRFEANGFLEMADRLVNPASPGQGDAEVVVGIGIIRLDVDGVLILADGLVAPAFPDQGDAEVVVSLGVSGLGGGFPDIGGWPHRSGLGEEGIAEVIVGPGRHPV